MHQGIEQKIGIPEKMGGPGEAQIVDGQPAGDGILRSFEEMEAAVVEILKARAGECDGRTGKIGAPGSQVLVAQRRIAERLRFVKDCMIQGSILVVDNGVIVGNALGSDA